MRRLFIAGIVFGSTAAWANKVTELDLWDPDPLEVEVASSDGIKYTHVTRTGELRFRLQADCQVDKKPGFQEHALNELEFETHGLSHTLVSPKWSHFGNDPPDYGDHYVQTPIDTIVRMKTSYLKPVPGEFVDPVQACNDELMRRAFNDPNTPREAFLAEGFDLLVDDGGALEVQLWCMPAAGGFIDEHTQHEEYDLKIRCLPSEKAAKALEPEPEPKKAHLAAFIQAVSVAVAPPHHEGACPVKHAVTGKVKVAYPGTFSYRYVDEKGVRSALRTQKAVAAGEYTLAGWYREVAPGVQGQFAATPGQGAERKGWYKLEIVSPVKVSSAPVAYSVRCEKPDATPAVPLKAPGALPGRPAPRPAPGRPSRQDGGASSSSSAPGALRLR
ncbi:MAG: hypothetical protein KatS3mg121_0334 [Gammaproteobacteria bacterium]|nr:MAG: hypothetical protein KatS3mg121_0334 [Gammaproteobacteria bacterium]